MDNELPEVDLISYLFQDCPYDPNKAILTDAADPSKSLSWTQIRLLIRQVAAGLTSRGIVPGDCVCLHGKNDIFNFVLVYGVIAVGGIYCSTSYFLKPTELATSFKKCEAKLVFVDPEFASPAIEACEACDISRCNLLLIERPKEFYDTYNLESWRSLLNHGEIDWLRMSDRATLKDTVAMRFFTSGTTGASKVAELTHYNLVSVQAVIMPLYVKPYESSSLYQIPMFHVTSSTIINGAFVHGIRLYLANYSGPEALAANIEKHKCTEIFMNPGMILALLNSPNVTPKQLESLRNPRTGGATLSPELAERFQKMLHPDAILNEGYGMTEVAGGFTGADFGKRTDNGAVGYLLPYCSAKIVDEEDKELSEPDTPGEILVKTPSAFKGYLNNPEANAEVYTHDGWLRTGDMGYFSSKDGMLILTGRKKETFKIFSEQVAPVEVENVLMRHPAVGDAVVFPVYDKDGIHAKVHAKIVLRVGVHDVDTATLLEFARAQLADYKVPSGGITVVQSIPRNAFGKIDRVAVRQI